MGLNESFAHVWGQILLMEPMSPLNDVVSLIMQEMNNKDPSHLPIKACVMKVQTNVKGKTINLSPLKNSTWDCEVLQVIWISSGFKTNKSKNSTTNQAISIDNGSKWNSIQTPNFSFTEEQYTSCLCCWSLFKTRNCSLVNQTSSSESNFQIS